jgi:hypothetical protein
VRAGEVFVEFIDGSRPWGLGRSHAGCHQHGKAHNRHPHEIDSVPPTPNCPSAEGVEVLPWT